MVVIYCDQSRHAGPKSFDGFIVVREGRHHHDADSRRCGKIEVALKFVCDVDMDWSSLSRDATLHVQRIRHAKGNPCQVSWYPPSMTCSFV